MKKLINLHLDVEKIELLKTISENTSEFIRQAIDEKIDSMNQKRKDVSAAISTNQTNTKRLEQMMGEVIMQNKVLFEQSQVHQELLKIILRRSSLSSLGITALMNEIAPQIDHDQIDKELMDMLVADVTDLKI